MTTAEAELAVLRQYVWADDTVLLVGAERLSGDPEEEPCDVCGVGWVDRYGRCDEWTCVLGGCQDEEEPA